MQVVGRDGPDDPEFELSGIITSQFDALLDFSPKGGPKNLAARSEACVVELTPWPRGVDATPLWLPLRFKLLEGGRPVVEFPDGNGWARISAKPVVVTAADIAREKPMSDDKRSGVAKILGSLGGG